MSKASKRHPKLSIDLNADLGEGSGNDHLLLPLISSCNVCCGAHAGNIDDIEETICNALEHKVKVGAHPSFPDRDNFGRKILTIEDKALFDSLLEQITCVEQMLKRSGKKLNHVKLHGALYHLSNSDFKTANLVCELIKNQFNHCKIYAPFGSLMAEIAQEKGLETSYEVFADRNYNDDLDLLNRSHKQAVIHDPQNVTDHVLRMVKDQQVKTINGTLRSIRAETVCVHGDNPAALQLLRHLKAALLQENITVV
ncbi:MAG: 5-oxoprolinase subunit PxpA [Chitinophagales bacterium]